MSSNPSARNARLRNFLNAVLHGEKPVGEQGSLFLDAVCAHPDPPACISSIIASDNGLQSLQEAIRSDFSTTFFNASVSSLLQYLRAPALKTIGGGQFLMKIILAIVDPPIFWLLFVEAFRAGHLQENTQLCFAWLLLQLILLPGESADPYRKVAEDHSTINLLLNLSHPDAKAIGLKIENVISTSTAVTQFDSSFCPGGRHDNDFVDFREIAILPTADEIGSTERPFFRPSSAFDEPETENIRTAMYLDNQFRLLREEMLHEMREEVQVLSGSKKGRNNRGIAIDGLTLLKIYCGPEGKRCKWGLALQCKDGLPHLEGQKSVAKRKAYLMDNSQGKKILRHQSLACLLFDDQVLAFPTIIRDEELLAQEHPIIVLQFDGERSTTKTLLKLKIAKKIKLVQIDTALFSYEPVLAALQQIKDLPLSRELLFWTDGSAVGSVPQLPKMESIIRRIQRDPCQDLRGFLGSSRSIILDTAQGDSLLSGLTQTVSLIQGPPGTGKSFIGALLAKFLHDYSEQTILVVCYTNHALDQFLKDLLDIGIPLESLVRLGAKSNAQTEPMMLRNQNRVATRSKGDWKVIDNCKAAAEIHVRSLELAFEQYKMTSIHNAEIMGYIEFEDYGFFQAFTVPTSTDGMTQVGKRGRAVDEYYLLNQWSHGNDAGIFKQHPDVLTSSKIWQMSSASRQAQVATWKANILKYQVTEVCRSAKEYDKCQIELQRTFQEGNIDILRNKRVIGCTTTGAAKYKESIQAVSPDVLLVEEAGEILESHVITALGADAKQMILIGDHKQLRPKVNNYALTVEKGDGYDLNRSLFERLVLKGYPHQTLVAQHRMRPEISSLIRHLTYPALIDAPSTGGRPNLRGVPDGIVFINHASPEDDNKQLEDRRDMGSKSSKQNTFEVGMVLKIVRYLVQQGYKTDELVVLTPYLGQLQKLREALKQETDPVLNDLDMNELIRAGVVTTPSSKQREKSLRLATIDNYQGEESNIVIASLCRSNSDNDIGFMFSPERLNVLLSRARNALIVIGNANTFTNARKGKDLWRQLLQLLRNGNHVYDGFPVVCNQHPSRTALLKTPVDFNTECPDGGCNNPCGIQLQCGIHTCPLKCHLSMLVPHSQILCPQIVKEQCRQGHSQARKCHQPPLPCNQCEREAALAEEKRQKEFELERQGEAQQTAHDLRLKDLEYKISVQKQIVQDARLAEQRSQVLRQKEEDLKEAQKVAASAKAAASAFFSPITSFFSSSSTSQSQTTSSFDEPKGTSKSHDSTAAANSTQPDAHHESSPSQRPHTPPGNPATEKKSPPEVEWQRQKDIEGASSAAIDAVMNMIGLEDVKRQMLRIKDKIEVTQRQNTSLKDERFNIVLLGNPGTGKTTVARQYAKFLTSQKILPGYAFLETTGARLAHEGVSGAEKLVKDALNAGGGAIFIDEAYQLTSQNGQHTHQGGQVLDFLLAEMENQVGTIVFILAGYSKQMEKFFDHNPGLPSRVPYTLKFADYTDQELLLMLAQYIRKKYHGKMKVEDGDQGLYTRISVRRLGRGRGREGFGNARALQNMFAKITERQAERISRMRREGQRPDDFLLLNEDIIGPDPAQAVKKSAAWTELQSLTGLTAVKESVRNLFDLILVNYRRELVEKEPMQMSLNRVFLGSPGTGKTTVGKLYGQILADIGMLSNGEVVIKNPADFVGSYIGHSEANTKAILASSVGKVLIIDEAYMLFGGRSHGSHTDSFKTAVIDTIVAEVQSVPGEDRAILLLGYEAPMREMFQNVNEGLSRRFAIEEAFKFEDFTDDELREILDGKLKKQDLSATDAAKDVAMELLGRERNRPNFGNGGAVENLLGHTKSRYVARFRGSMPPSDTVFEPQDFDPEFDRHLHASENLDKMFEDVIGCEAIIDKLREYQKISRVMKARGEDMRDLIPTNFVFKGPPGTGKTTVARKISQVYYDMGFLASAKVEECSASDLVGQYVGHTGPKTKKIFEKAVGQVLFIDEAYRLGDGRFAQEAVDEMVGLLTHEKFKSKIVVILAGYDRDINKLLSVNSGLSSRFPEVIQFRNFAPKACLEILDKRLRQNKISLNELRNPSSKGYSVMLSVVEDLSGIPSWGNARDMETLAKQMSGLVLKRLPDSSQPAELTLQTKDAVTVMLSMLDEKRGRSNMPPMSHPEYEDIEEVSSSSPPPPPAAQQQQQSSPPPRPPPQQQEQHRQPPAPNRSGKQRMSNTPQTPSPQQGPSNAASPPQRPDSSVPAGTSSPQSPRTLERSSLPALPPQQHKQYQQPPAPNRSRKQRTFNAPPASSPQEGPSNTAPPPLRLGSASASTSSTFQSPKSLGSQQKKIQAQSQTQKAVDNRDPDVSDAVWMQLQADKKAEADTAKVMKEEIHLMQTKVKPAVQLEERNRAAARAFVEAEAAAKDAAACQEAERQRKDFERKAQAAKAERERLVQALNRKKEEEKKRKEAEVKVQTTLRRMGVCVQGYQWVKQPNGYRCRGGAHFISNDQLE